MDTNTAIVIAFGVVCMVVAALAWLPSTAPLMQRIFEGRWVNAFHSLAWLGIAGISFAPAPQQSFWVALFFLGAAPAIIRWLIARPLNVDDNEPNQVNDRGVS